MLEPLCSSSRFLVDVIDQSDLDGVLAWLQDHKIEIERVNPV